MTVNNTTYNKGIIQQNFSYVDTVNNFFEFLDVTPKTANTYRKALKQLILFLNEKGINNPNRENIITFKKELEIRGLKASTIALYISAAKRLFQWTEQAGIYPNITTGIKAPKIDRNHKKDCLAGSQIKNILKSIDRNTLEGKRNFAMLALMAGCGLRTIELARANVEDLRNIGGVSVLFICGKGRNSKSEFVKLSPQVEEAIRDYLKARGQAEDSEPLFISHSRRNNGQRLTTRTIRGAAKNAMTAAGYISARLTAHSFRHSAITIALIGGQSLQEVKAFARHSNINTTLIYAHNISRLQSQCESVISNAIF